MADQKIVFGADGSTRVVFTGAPSMGDLSAAVAKTLAEVAGNYVSATTDEHGIVFTLNGVPL